MPLNSSMYHICIQWKNTCKDILATFWNKMKKFFTWSLSSSSFPDMNSTLNFLDFLRLVKYLYPNFKMLHSSVLKIYHKVFPTVL